jgi:hypothetical protein
MYTGLQHAHSGLRWLVLVLILWVIVQAFSGFGKSARANDGLRKPSLFAMITAHLQALLGLGLLMMSNKVMFSGEMMKSAVHRFFTMEHTLMMLIAVVLVTIGHGKAKAGLAKPTFWYYLVALLLILAAIPWPFRAELGGHWF